MNIRPYLSAFSVQWRVGLRYRIAIFAGFAAQLWFGAITLMVYAAVYRHAPHVQAPMSLAQAMSYTWLQQALFRLLPIGCLPQVGDAARTGAIAFDLLRPLNLWSWWYSASFSWLAGSTFPRAALMILAAGPLAALCGLSDWGLAAPASAMALAMALLSFLLGASLSATMVMWLNILTARTLSPRGSYAIATPLAVLLSGMLLPLPLYPDWVRLALLAQPFAGVSDIPIRIYLGVPIPGGSGTGLALQAGWIVALTVLGRFWLGRVVERLEVQGG
ncbi:ABC transporter permease [Kozakia baliensis]|uniref:ABC transporter permease n=1 Tax=Kozakia baliensis TaxID=153496 RepID=A0A1D8USZ4_9PROT|nr:ABC-2 family transporter protein [Kozakia baliensis]AOX16760.1 ABC transporter permease [Kozakia baliensis]GBR31946.1 ABC transporter permease [Kozakia baliensis NRIC 0488]GEL64691.1 ABC transporter permease [Kozakia baliensis]